MTPRLIHENSPSARRAVAVHGRMAEGSPLRNCCIRPWEPRNRINCGSAAEITTRNTTISRTRLCASKRTRRSRIPVEQNRLKKTNNASEKGAHRGTLRIR